MINVTKPFSPPLDEVQAYLKDIWERNWFTNNGPLVNELELKLKEYLDLKYFLFLTNGTIAIQLAIKALGLNGKIITTPFSYIATTSSILWENCEPVYADIDPATLNIDPSSVEKMITPDTTAILATHVFGNPCDIDALSAIANKHGLKIIYDGAHGFGSKYKGKSLLDFGDVCTTSFHATKLFHTIEGGAVTTQDPELLKRIAYMRNFGHNGPEDFECVGINGKNCEMHAAVGLVNLRYADDILRSRKELAEYYFSRMENLNVQNVQINADGEWNYSYMPVIFPNEEQLLRSVTALNDNWTHPRRYFYPSLSTLRYHKSNSAPISESISKRILCLPLYHDLKKEDIDFIVRILMRVQNN